MGKREQAKQLVKAKQQHSLVIPRGCSQGLSSFLGILGPQTLQGMFIILMYSLRHKTHQLLLSAFQHKEAGGGLLARACRGRTSAKGFKRKEGRFISNVRKTLPCEGGGTSSWRCGRSPIPGSTQGQVGLGSEQPHLDEDVRAHSRRAGLDDL